MRVLIGGVGYRHLRDHSFGVLVVDALAERAWPADVRVEDISYGPIAVVQRLEDDGPEVRPERLVIVSAVERAGREPGALTVYRWDGVLPAADVVQTAVTEAVTGVIAMDNTLVVTQHFRALPGDVVVIELQPGEETFGDGLSPAAGAVFSRACDLAAAAALDPGFLHAIPTFPLGGGARIPRTARPQVSDVPPRIR